MISVVKSDNQVLRNVAVAEEIDGEVVSYVKQYEKTDFIADGFEDIEAMNAEGSEYLNYPAGSTVKRMDNDFIYVLNADCTRYFNDVAFSHPYREMDVANHTDPEPEEE